MGGKVWLVGAGPGDPELLTVKALRLIGSADVILYDRLANPELLNHARPTCEMVYVGKQDGRHTLCQDSINELLVEHARKADVVVRLKGGDPFVFGRGGEEAMFVRKHGIPFEVVPGVTSAISAPACAGIPVTHRQVACSFAVITGHEAPGGAHHVDWRGMSAIDTLVFLMGVTARQAIARKLLEAGRRPEEPAAFIERGTTETQHVIETTLAELAENPPEVASPAILIVGEVVRLRRELGGWFENALAGAPAEGAEVVP